MSESIQNRCVNCSSARNFSTIMLRPRVIRLSLCRCRMHLSPRCALSQRQAEDARDVIHANPRYVARRREHDFHRFQRGNGKHLIWPGTRDYFAGLGGSRSPGH